MASILDSVDQRTNLVGENRLELLLFHLQGRQLFALNVFKVKEVVKLPRLNQLPNSHPMIAGVVSIRGQSIPVINLKGSIGLRPLAVDEQCNLIITEYNRTVQGFLVGKVEHIINQAWSEIIPPPSSAGHHHYITAITKLERKDNVELVEIIDVEKVLSEIVDYRFSISEGIVDNDISHKFAGRKILHADDSLTARKQVEGTLSQLGLEIIPARNGQEALDMLKSWADQGKKIEDEILMLITDAEMPVMDGYKLTNEVRNDPRMSGLHIILNTSLSGSFNKSMVKKVGCDDFLSKFQPDLLVQAVQDYVKNEIPK